MRPADLSAESTVANGHERDPWAAVAHLQGKLDRLDEEGEREAGQHRNERPADARAVREARGIDTAAVVRDALGMEPEKEAEEDDAVEENEREQRRAAVRHDEGGAP